MKFYVSSAVSTSGFMFESEPRAVSHFCCHRLFGIAVTIAEQTLPKNWNTSDGS